MFLTYTFLAPELVSRSASVEDISLCTVHSLVLLCYQVYSRALSWSGFVRLIRSHVTVVCVVRVSIQSNYQSINL